MKTRTKKLAALAVAVCLTAGLAYGRIYERLQALFAGGSATLPGISFVSDPNTGVANIAADTVSSVTGGVESARFSANAMAFKGAGATNSITSDTAASVANTGVAALTFAPTATLQANDLVAEFNSAAGASLYSVDLEGDTLTAGDIGFAGGNLNSSATTGAAIFTSDTNATTMTDSVPAIRMLASATPDLNDMVFEVMYGTTSILSVDKEGDLTIAGSFTFSPGDITMTGGDLTSSKTDQTLNVVSATADGTTDGNVAAITMKASATLTAGDLVLEVNDHANTSLLTCNQEGDVVALGDVSVSGNDFNCAGTGACNLISSTSDGNTNTGAAAITLKSGVNLTDGDLVLAVKNSANDVLFSVNEQGATTALTSIAATTSVTAGTTLTVGGGTAVAKITSQVVADQDIGSVAGGAATALAINVTGATLGDSVICQTVQDDAAWDHCSLSCFVESAGVVKLLALGDSTGCDPAATDDYRITLMRF